MKLLILTLFVFLAGCGSTRVVVIPEVKMPTIPSELKTPPEYPSTIRPQTPQE